MHNMLIKSVDEDGGHTEDGEGIISEFFEAGLEETRDETLMKLIW